MVGSSGSRSALAATATAAEPPHHDGDACESDDREREIEHS
jgi:hypothetical protein